MKLLSKSFAVLTYLVVIVFQNVTAQEHGRHYRIVKNVKITEKPIPDMLKLNRMTEQRFACKYFMFLDLCTCDYIIILQFCQHQTTWNACQNAMWQNGTKEILTFTANQSKGKIGKKIFFQGKEVRRCEHSWPIQLMSP